MQAQNPRLKKKRINRPFWTFFESDSLIGHGIDLEVYKKADNASFTRVIYSLLLVSSILLLLRSWAASDFLNVVIHLSIAIFSLLGVVRIWIRRNGSFFQVALFVLLLSSLGYAFWSSDFSQEGFLLVFAFPFILMHLLGAKIGFYFTVLLQLALLFLFFMTPAVGQDALDSGFFLPAILINFLFIGYLTYLHEKREERYAEIIRSEAYLDPLTGLPNRARLIMDLEEVGPAALFLVNIDDFKEINDSFGYDMGDQVLLFLVQKIKEVMPKNDASLYRVGGDEFAVLVKLRSKVGKEEHVSFINLLRHYINSKKFVAGLYELFLRTTIGAAESAGHHQENLFSQADIALKSAKKSNKPYLFFELKEAVETKRIFHQNIMIAQTLAEAIEREKVVTFYQPIYCNTSRKICKYECLVRVQDEGGKILQPAEFLGLAMKTRLNVFLTRAVIKQAFECFRNNSFSFSINLSIHDIENINTRNFIFKKLESVPHLKGRLIFEILESEGILNYSQIVEFIRKVKSYGFKVAIDDFGSGYSNFRHVQNLEVDYLKIDGSLIKDLDVNPNSRILVETIVSFARKMGINTIAEYVHSESVFAVVREMGIDYSQGYFIGKPDAKLVEGVGFCP